MMLLVLWCSFIVPMKPVPIKAAGYNPLFVSSDDRILDVTDDFKIAGSTEVEVFHRGIAVVQFCSPKVM